MTRLLEALRISHNKWQPNSAKNCWIERWLANRLDTYHLIKIIQEEYKNADIS